MSFLIRQTLIYAVPLMIVALAGIYAERSGIINLALEGIMIFGAFMGVLFVRLVQMWGWFDAAKAAGNWMALQGFMTLAKREDGGITDGASLAAVRIVHPGRMGQILN